MGQPADIIRYSSLRGLLLTALVVLGISSSAQLDTIKVAFQQLTIEDGLSQGMIYDILQDRYGFMWFATKDGLNRYDGYTFNVLRHDPKDSNSLGNSLVLDLMEDHEGFLWVGTNSGLDVFDPATEIFHHVIFPNDGTGTPAINRIAQDPQGRIWAMSFHGLYVIAQHTGPYSAMPILANQVQIGSHLRGMTIDSNGILRAWSRDSLVSIQCDTRNEHFRPDTIKYLPTTPEPPLHEDSLPALGLIMCEDTLRDRTYGVHCQGIMRLNDDKGQHPLGFPIMDFTVPWSAAVDGNGEMWLTTTHALWTIDIDAPRIRRVLPEDPRQSELLEHAADVYLDRGGLLWIGTTGHGLLRYDPHARSFHPDRCGSVRWLAPAMDGQVMCCTDVPYRYDPKTGRLSAVEWPVGAVGNGLVRSNYELSLVQDGRGRTWSNLLDFPGLIRTSAARQRSGLDPRSLDALSHTISGFPLVLSGDTILCFGSWRNFCWLDLRTLQFVRHPYPISDLGGIYTLVQSIVRDRDGIFWLGTMKGLLRFDPGDNSWKRYGADQGKPHALTVEAVFCLLEDPIDPHHFLWAGTYGGGLFRMNKRTGEFTRYGRRNGLPNEVVYGVLADEDGRLWMSTNQGLVRLDPATGAIRIYDVNDGLQSNEFNRYAYCKLQDGTLFFGGVNGLNHFDPHELRDDLRPVQVAITGIKLMNKPLVYGQAGSPLRIPAHLARTIALPYSAASMLTIDFASLEFRGIDNRQYRYQLDGFDPQVIEAGHAHSAIYTNLGPGEYTFNVWGRNRDGVWNQAPQQLLVNILPPWYMTGWARALFAFALIGAGLLFLHARTRSLRRQRDRLESTVRERTSEMRSAKERAEHSEHVKQQFLANMSHEIRTPLHAIVGMNNALLRKDHLSGQVPYLDAIANSSGHLLQLVNSILDLSKIEAGRMEPERLPMEPRAVLTAVADVMRHRVEENGLFLVTEVSDEVPKNLIGDPGRLNQVLMNLVSNAIKFTEHGSIRVTMDAKKLHTGAVMLRCVVKDTGIGIAPDRLPHIFDEFTQADNSHTRKYGGSGLGLTISKRLVEMLGGTIEAKSSPGRGSTFTLTIPYLLPADPNRTDLRNEPATIGPPPLSGLYILLAEDHPINVMVAKDELTDAIPGVRIEVAANGKIAVDMASKRNYDLILMDVQMPEMDGYAATRAIRALEGDRARVPIVGVTANVMRTELERCTEAGMDGFVTKPFQQEELLDAMAKAMERRSR